MEKDSTTPETKFNLSQPSTRLKILCQYIHCECTFAGMGTARLSVDFLAGNKSNIEDISVLVKPLDKISDGDAIEVSNIVNGYGYEDNGKDIVINMLQVKEYYDENPPEWITPFTWLAICDFLRANGYALPYGKYSVEQLVDAGIYQII